MGKMSKRAAVIAKKIARYAEIREKLEEIQAECERLERDPDIRRALTLDRAPAAAESRIPWRYVDRAVPELFHGDAVPADSTMAALREAVSQQSGREIALSTITGAVKRLVAAGTLLEDRSSRPFLYRMAAADPSWQQLPPAREAVKGMSPARSPPPGSSNASKTTSEE